MVSNNSFKYMVIHDVKVIIAYYDISKFPDKDYSDLLNYLHKKHGKKYSVAYAVLDSENKENILLTPLLTNYEAKSYRKSNRPFRGNSRVLITKVTRGGIRLT